MHRRERKRVECVFSVLFIGPVKMSREKKVECLRLPETPITWALAPLGAGGLLVFRERLGRRMHRERERRRKNVVFVFVLFALFVDRENFPFRSNGAPRVMHFVGGFFDSDASRREPTYRLECAESHIST